VSGLLEGRRALITGGAQGIGLAVARAYLAAGARVAVADVADGPLEAARAELEPLAPGRVVARRLDVTDEAATDALADELESAFGGIDVCVPNAGILVLKHGIELEVAAWRRVIEVNLTGAFVTARAFARRMVAAGRPGRIVFTSSLFGLRGGVENSAYSASKFGMIGLMQCLAAELAPRGVLVNCVCPGQMNTDMIARLFEERAALRGVTPESLRAGFESKIPVGRLGGLDELAGTYVFLASALSAYTTGQSLVVDGGWQVGS
jgi:NAD(P)-dependent dehydrogenase (short-subunit alcohol dehydrogenase family)